MMLMKLISIRYSKYFSPIFSSLGKYVDFIVCLGGDGVILHAAYLFKHSVPPVIYILQNINSLFKIYNKSMF